MRLYSLIFYWVIMRRHCHCNFLPKGSDNKLLIRRRCLRLTGSNLERTLLFVHREVLKVHDTSCHDCQSLGVEDPAIGEQSGGKILYSLNLFSLKDLASSKANKQTRYILGKT